MSKVTPFLGPGRPRTVVPRRSARMEQRVAAHHADAARFVEADEVVRAASSKDDLEGLYVARLELAREAAGLLFMRLQAVPGSREQGRLATRRIAALREVASLTVAISRAVGSLPSPAAMRRILESLGQAVDEAAASVLPADVAERFSNAWREAARPQFDGLEFGLLQRALGGRPFADPSRAGEDPSSEPRVDATHPHHAKPR